MRWRWQDEKSVETLQRQTMGVIFDTQNSQLLTWSLPTEEIFFRYTAKIGLWQIFQLSIFVLSRENAITKATEYVTFAFSVRILVFFHSKKV